MIETFAFATVVCTGFFFLALGSACLAVPSSAGGFLLGFAGSPSKHYLELAIRLLVGGSFVVLAPRMSFQGVFTIFGWILLATTAGLLLVPWRWHHRFAQRAVPQALRFLPAIGVSSLVLGGLVLAAVFYGDVVR